MEQLAEKTGVPRSTIAAFEVGKRPLPDEHRATIENFLEVEIVENAKEPVEPIVVKEPDGGYYISSPIFSKVPTDQLESALTSCVQEKDWLAVQKIAAELADRKMMEKLK